MPTSAPISTSNTRSAAKAAFTHITNAVLDNPNVTNALLEDDIKQISGILALDDTQIDDLTYLDTDPSNLIAYCLKKRDKGLIRSFIHFVHYHDEINDPIGDS
jgi:hypothetical protein